MTTIDAFAGEPLRTMPRLDAVVRAPVAPTAGPNAIAIKGAGGALNAARVGVGAIAENLLPLGLVGGLCFTTWLGIKMIVTGESPLSSRNHA